MQIETNRSLHCIHEAREDRLYDLFPGLCPRHRRVLGLPNYAWREEKGPGIRCRLAYCPELQPKQAGGLVAKHVLLDVGRVCLQKELFAE
jgi:hypothetical protein